MLFEENIRSYLGVKARANKRMNETLNKREDAVYFPFMNNSITIICDELILPRQPQNSIYLLPVINPKIVNGLQTSWVLFENYKKDKSLLEDVYVNIRVYESKDKALIVKITDATNTQTPINYRDKISNKDFNTYAKEIFANIKVNYIIKRGEFFSKDNSQYKDSIESELVLKFWYASFFEEPETAKNSISTILQRIFDSTYIENHPLEKLFNGDKNSPIYSQLLTAYKIYRFIQNEKSQFIDKYDFISYSDELLCYGIYKKIGINLVDYNDSDKLNRAYKDSVAVINETLTGENQNPLKQEKIFVQ